MPFHSVVSKIISQEQDLLITHYQHYRQLIFLGHRCMRKYALHNWAKILALVFVTQQCHTLFKIS